MNEQVTEPRATDHNEWFAAFLPKREVPPQDSARTSEVAELPSAIEEVRTELRAVAGHLIDPSTAGVQASLPHLERAVAVFSDYVKMKQLPTLEPALDDLRSELALATMLFENAYTLQAGWAAQIGLNLDGSPKQLLYARPGQSAVSQPAVASWEG